VLESGWYKAPLSYVIYSAYYCPTFVKVGPYWIKIYVINYKCFWQGCFSILDEKKLKMLVSKMAIFWPFVIIFWQLHRYISQNWDSDGYFEVLSVSKSKLDQKLWHYNWLKYFFFMPENASFQGQSTEVCFDTSEKKLAVIFSKWLFKKKPLCWVIGHIIR
jgi:hypothetical protein